MSSLPLFFAFWIIDLDIHSLLSVLGLGEISH